MKLLRLAIETQRYDLAAHTLVLSAAKALQELRQEVPRRAKTSPRRATQEPERA